MTEVIKQRYEDDCVICCIAMATGRTWEEVHAVASNTENGYVEGRGTSSEIAVLNAFGIKARSTLRVAVRGQCSDDLATHYEAIAIGWKAMLWGRRALVALPSMNGWVGWHCCYWDGDKLIDPSNKQSYSEDAMKDRATVPIRIVMLWEL